MGDWLVSLIIIAVCVGFALGFFTSEVINVSRWLCDYLLKKLGGK